MLQSTGHRVGHDLATEPPPQYHTSSLPLTAAYSLPGGASGKQSSCQRRISKRCGFDPRKIPWRRKWQPAPVFLPGKSHEQRPLVGYSPWGHKRVSHDLATKYQRLLTPEKTV